MNNEHNILGKKGEDMAAKFLKKQGMKILERNWRIGDLETDIIAKEGDTLVFAEVKTRTAGGWKRPEEAVDKERQIRLTTGAKAYIAQKRWDGPWRFDIVAIEIADEKEEIYHIKDAFLPVMKTVTSRMYSGESRWQQSKTSTRARGAKKR